MVSVCVPGDVGRRNGGYGHSAYNGRGLIGWGGLLPMFGLWHFLHLIGVVIWVGGMVFALFCLQPAAAGLNPPERVPLMAAALGRFFSWVLTAIGLIWLSGLLMLSNYGLKDAPLGWHLMIGIAALMTLIFLFIRFALFRKVTQSVAGGELAAAAPIMGKIRTLVLVNLVLGVAAIASVSLLV